MSGSGGSHHLYITTESSRTRNVIDALIDQEQSGSRGHSHREGIDPQFRNLNFIPAAFVLTHYLKYLCGNSCLTTLQVHDPAFAFILNDTAH